MSLHIKMMLVIIGAVFFSGTLVWKLIDIEQRRQMDIEALQYLENAFALAATIKSASLKELQLAGKNLADNPEFFERMGDSRYLRKKFNDFKEMLPNLDFLAVILPDSMDFLSTSHKIIGIPPALREMLALTAPETRPAGAELVFDLADLFEADSPEMQQFQVRLMDTGIFFQKCLVSVCVVPVYREGGLKAYLLLAAIANNDSTMPDWFSRSIENAYFSIAVDGVRICSNVQDAAGTVYLGSRSPSVRHSNGFDFEFGRMNVGTERHVFLTKYFTDYKQDIIATLGVGLPEERFYAIMDTNKKVSLLTSTITLLAVLSASYLVIRKINQPINLSTAIAQRITSGEREIVVPEKMLRGNQETAKLLRALKEMAKSRQTMEDEIDRVVYDLRDSKERLEEKVAQRTQELRQAIGELEKSNKVKTQFLSNMTHELRTPLSAIICSGEALTEGHFGALNDKQGKYVENMIYSGKHLLQIINNILDISKIDAGMMKPAFKPFLFEDALEYTLLSLNSMAARKEITIHKNCPEVRSLIYADETKIRQILYNLLSNAFKFVHKQGTVWITVCTQGNMLHVSVKDNGIGIHKKVQERIFDPFEQADNSYAREYEGTGLGLYLCRSLVEMHGGNIYLHSQEGVGTEVMFTIPPGGFVCG